MLSRLLFVRLKAAENALRDARLDEAYRLATAPDIREHRRGAAVLAKLAKKLLERARTHFRADRFTEAMADLERARAGNVLQEEIAELAQHVRTVAAEQERRQQSRHERLQDARRRIEGGSIAAGRKILENAGAGDHAAEALARAAGDRAGEAAEILKEVEQLMGQGRMSAAAGRLKRAMMIDAHNERTIRLETKLCDRVLGDARKALVEGKLRRAADELNCLGDIGKSMPSRRELADALALARDTAGCLERREFAQARRHAMSLARLLPGARWARNAADQLKSLDDVVTALAAGPLGEHMNRHRASESKRSPEGVDPRSLNDTVAMPARAGSSATLPPQLLLLVEGGGSYLILRGDHASLGRVATEHPADVPIYGDVAERHANVNRVDEDYFLFANKEVEVGGRKTKHQLLRDGDRIVLARKAKLTFRMPSRRSATAVLDLSDTTKMPNDVRRVVLFNGHAIVGASQSAHIRCQHAGPPLVLFERNEKLWIRQKNDGHVDNEAVELRLGKPVEIAGASLVLQPWAVRTPGQRIV